MRVGAVSRHPSKTHKVNTVARLLGGKVLFCCLLCGKVEPGCGREDNEVAPCGQPLCKQKRARLAALLASAQNTPPAAGQATV
eukprot:1650151-Prymnesium_polylepis.1